MIAQAVGMHVDINAEAVRGKWVFEGKKILTVHTESITSGETFWASIVEGFSDQIEENTVDGVVEALSPPFSGTTKVKEIAQKIVVMDVCKNFFSYSK
jgi:hypothetical protein